VIQAFGDSAFSHHALMSPVTLGWQFAKVSVKHNGFFTSQRTKLCRGLQRAPRVT
jgi:hypothetical protein